METSRGWDPWNQIGNSMRLGRCVGFDKVQVMTASPGGNSWSDASQGRKSIMEGDLKLLGFHGAECEAPYLLGASAAPSGAGGMYALCPGVTPPAKIPQPSGFKKRNPAEVAGFRSELPSWRRCYWINRK